jgi:hypothetical protein
MSRPQLVVAVPVDLAPVEHLDEQHELSLPCEARSKWFQQRHGLPTPAATHAVRWQTHMPCGHPRRPPFVQALCIACVSLLSHPRPCSQCGTPAGGLDLVASVSPLPRWSA